jgi:hypothetical protein
MKFEYTFSFAEPVYVDIPMTQLLSYYPHFNINSPKTVGLMQPPLATQQISVSAYNPVYQQKQLVPPAKAPPIVPATFTTKVSLN